jgi:hypothetical protein
LGKLARNKKSRTNGTLTDGDKPAEKGLGLRVEGSAQEGHEITIERDGALTGLFNTDDPDQASALLSHCLKTLHGNEAGDAGEASDERKFMLSVVKETVPRDAVERMLAVQMAATHVATIRTAGMLARADMLPQYEAYDRAFNKLTRTFTSQVEALRKYRNGGRQTVTVQHVNVEDGGQAIVGNVKARGRGNDE